MAPFLLLFPVISDDVRCTGRALRAGPPTDTESLAPTLGDLPGDEVVGGGVGLQLGVSGGTHCRLTGVGG